MTMSTPVPQDELLKLGRDILAREEPVLRRVLFRYLRDDHLVDDLYQEVAIKVLKRIHTVREVVALRGWIFQLARNACLDQLRKMKRQPHLTEATLSDLPHNGHLGRHPIGRLISEERVEAVQRAMADLPPSQQETLRLRLEEGCDHSQIAERLGISRQAVEVRLCRARATLKDRLHHIMEGDL